MQPDKPPSCLKTRAAEAFSRGHSLLLEREVAGAIDAFHHAETLGYSVAECAAGRWQCWMLQGNFERAWQESDRIAASGVIDPHKCWDGSSWEHRRVMLRCLHGLGDTLNFIRYAPLLRQTCSHLMVQTHPQLVSLIANASGVDEVFSWEAPYCEDSAAWDVQMEVNELPRIFRTSFAGIPAHCPYISIPQSHVSRAAQWFPEWTRPRIGLIWEAGPWDTSRSIELSEMEPLLSIPDFEFFCLQKGVDDARLAPYPQLHPVQTRIQAVLDTAALMAHLDLIITVDTMTAHLAGALAKPVWVLLTRTADWRWMLNTCASPWYPSARLFRQQRSGDWSQSLEEVRRALFAGDFRKSWRKG